MHILVVQKQKSNDKIFWYIFQIMVYVCIMPTKRNGSPRGCPCLFRAVFSCGRIISLSLLIWSWRQLLTTSDLVRSYLIGINKSRYECIPVLCHTCSKPFSQSEKHILTTPAGEPCYNQFDTPYNLIKHRYSESRGGSYTGIENLLQRVMKKQFTRGRLHRLLLQIKWLNQHCHWGMNNESYPP